MTRRAMLLALGLGCPAALALGWGLSEWMISDRKGAVGSFIAQRIGPFALIDHTGRRVTDRDFAGRVRLVFFGFTHCPDVCPTGLGYMADALDELTDAELAQVSPIFISVDPGRDTPELLASYVVNFHRSLLGLTGSEAEVARAARAFQTYYRRTDTGGDSYVVDHSASIYLVGADGRLNGFLDTHEPVETAVAKIRLSLPIRGER